MSLLCHWQEQQRRPSPSLLSAEKTPHAGYFARAHLRGSRATENNIWLFTALLQFFWTFHSLSSSAFKTRKQPSNSIISTLQKDKATIIGQAGHLI
jgi:hypothetical protein